MRRTLRRGVIGLYRRGYRPMYNPLSQSVCMSTMQAPINPQGDTHELGRVVEELDKTPIQKVFGNDRGAILVTEDKYEQYTEKSGLHGNPSGSDPGSFVAKASEIRRLLRNSRSWREVEDALGFSAGYLANSQRVLLLEVHHPVELNLHWPTKESAGANEYWIPGGRTSGGMTEGFICQVPRRTIMVTSDGEFRTYNNFTIQAVTFGEPTPPPLTPFTTGTTWFSDEDPKV